MGEWRWGSVLVGLLALTCLVGCPKGDDDDDDDDTVQDAVPPWPEWAFHHWIWEGESTQESATTIVADYLDQDIPVGAIIIDSPWATGYNTFVWDPALFPDPQGFIDDMHAQDVRVLLWVTPAINTDVEDLYAYAEEHQYFMQASENSGPAVVDWWKGEGSLIDYFNPEAVAWWHGLIEPILAMDIDGWKCDGLDFSAILAPYSPGLGANVTRLEYSHAYYRDFHDITRDALGDDRINTARPVDTYGADLGGDAVAFAPVDINWAGWVGDQDGDFFGLEMALLNMYWSADYGYVAFGSDIGGYRSDDSELGRTRESFIRWLQVGAFCPVMENGGGGEHRPWMFDTETADIYRAFTDLHYTLLPYLMREGAVAFENGESLMTFRNTITYDYLLGPDVFVAPILAEGTSRTVEFPDGDWIWLFGDQGTYGGDETFEVPYDSFTAFARAGSRVAGELGL